MPGAGHHFQRYLCANRSHLVFAWPSLDGPTALAAALDAAGDMTIATTVALPTLRGTVQTAQLLRALHTLSGSRLIAGPGPGSSPPDYLAAGVPFSERWRRSTKRCPRCARPCSRSPIPRRCGSPAGAHRPVFAAPPPSENRHGWPRPTTPRPTRSPRPSIDSRNWTTAHALPARHRNHLALHHQFDLQSRPDPRRGPRPRTWAPRRPAARRRAAHRPGRTLC